MNANKLLKVRTEHSYEIKILFDLLKEILTECNLTFMPNTVTKQRDEEQNKDGTKKNLELVKKNDGGIKIMAVNDHSSLLIYVKLNADKFCEFYVKHHMNVGINIQELYKFLKSINKDSIMTISIDKDDEQRIEFHLNDQINSKETIYRQTMMDLDDNAMRIPKTTQVDLTVIIPTSEFRKVCSTLGQFAEYMEIICTRQEIIFKCVGDSSECVEKFKSGGSNGVKIYCKSDDKTEFIYQAIYNLRHIMTFGKCVNLCNDMQMFLKNNYPLFLNYTVGDLGKLLVGLSPIDPRMIKN